MMAMDVPIECGGAPVASGDLVFGDVDGVVVIPEGITDKVIKTALERISGENQTRPISSKGSCFRRSTRDTASFKRRQDQEPQSINKGEQG
jgi:regulator of RNase E activity RraA